MTLTWTHSALKPQLRGQELADGIMWLEIHSQKWLKIKKRYEYERKPLRSGRKFGGKTKFQRNSRWSEQNNERCEHGDLQDLKMTTSNFYNYNLHVRECRVWLCLRQIWYWQLHHVATIAAVYGLYDVNIMLESELWQFTASSILKGAVTRQGFLKD